jgi:hypothetical protein
MDVGIGTFDMQAIRQTACQHALTNHEIEYRGQCPWMRLHPRTRPILNVIKLPIPNKMLDENARDGRTICYMD